MPLNKPSNLVKLVQQCIGQKGHSNGNLLGVLYTSNWKVLGDLKMFYTKLGQGQTGSFGSLFTEYNSRIGKLTEKNYRNLHKEISPRYSQILNIKEQSIPCQ
jgi:hypothetical protein